MHRTSSKSTFGYPLEGSGGVESSPLDFFPPGAFSSSLRFVPLPRPPPSLRSDIASGMKTGLIMGVFISQIGLNDDHWFP